VEEFHLIGKIITERQSFTTDARTGPQIVSSVGEKGFRGEAIDAGFPCSPVSTPQSQGLQNL
jgi:hypothetical protein